MPPPASGGRFFRVLFHGGPGRMYIIYYFFRTVRQRLKELNKNAGVG